MSAVWQCPECKTHEEEKHEPGCFLDTFYRALMRRLKASKQSSEEG